METRTTVCWVAATIFIVSISLTEGAFLLKDHVRLPSSGIITLGTKKSLHGCAQVAQMTSISAVFGGFNYNFFDGTCQLTPKAGSCGNQNLVRRNGWGHMMLTSCGVTQESVVPVTNNNPLRGGFANSLLGVNNFARQTASVCNGIFAYQVAFGVPLPASVITSVGFHNCLNSCELSAPFCVGISFSSLTNNCDIQTTTTSIVTTINSVYFRRFCFRGTVITAGTTVATTTTTTRPTTTPPLSFTQLIGDSGKCPDRFWKLTSTNLLGGVLVTGASTADGCKSVCLNNASCVAVDFNNDSNQCFFHSTLNGTLQDGTQGCCDHFRLINCDATQCHRQLVLNMALPSTLDIQNVLIPVNTGVTATTLTSCASQLCMTTFTFDASNTFALTQSLDRGCSANSAEPTLGCDVTSSGGVTTTTCVCAGHRCNSYDVFTQQELIAYYPLDCDGSDLSGYHRDAVGRNITFDIRDAKRNWTAVFDGSSSYFQVNDFSQIQIGTITSTNTTASGFNAQAGFATAFWVKRTSSAGVQVILSNGNMGTAPIEVISTIVSGTQTITMNLRLRNTAANATIYLVTAAVSGLSLNQWYFVAAQLNVNLAVSSTTVNLVMWAGQTLVTENTVTGTSISVPNANTPLIATFAPLCIGKQFGSNVPSFFFGGRIDEVYLFQRGNMVTNAFQSIMDQSKTFV